MAAPVSTGTGQPFYRMTGFSYPSQRRNGLLIGWMSQGFPRSLTESPPESDLSINKHWVGAGGSGFAVVLISIPHMFTGAWWLPQHA